MTLTVGMKSLAVQFPRTVRTNDYWRQKHPAMVASAEQKSLANLWASRQERKAPLDPFDIEMAPYLSDPFRGSERRHVLLPEETSLSIQVPAARAALAAARLDPRDVDLTIVSTFQQDRLDTGNAAFVARELGLGGTAFNLETACSSSLVAFHTACGLIQSGLYRRALVVVACRYSHVQDETDPLAWVSGDGAGAFVVGEVPAGEGFVAHTSEHTAATCDAFHMEYVVDPITGPQRRMRADPSAGRLLRKASTDHLVSCCNGAARAAGVSLRDIDFFVFHTPTPWFHAFAARLLDIDPARTISINKRYGNIGPALMPANLFHAAHEGRIKKGDLVMLHAVGSVSSASAVVMRWGDVPLGPPPPLP
jgi:3-oxoacyl-[acyl-carrier-protein] synthase III